jgi:hypothetical protein
MKIDFFKVFAAPKTPISEVFKDLLDFGTQLKKYIFTSSHIHERNMIVSFLFIM